MDLRSEILKFEQITIIDYGVGNLLSVKKGLEKCGARVKISSDAKEILSANKIVFPGVGAFPNAMSALEKLHLVEALIEFAELKRPILAICLGMQLLMDQSDEFQITKGLGIIPGGVSSIPTSSVDGLKLKIPHIGWNPLLRSDKDRHWGGTVLEGVTEGESVYFVHSYMVEPKDETVRVANTIYGGKPVAAVIAREQIVGCQFHPEKSGKVGLKILQNFVLG